MDDNTEQESNKRSPLIWIVPIVIAAGLVVCCAPAGFLYMMLTGTYDVDTVRFDLTDPATATSGADGSLEPGIYIDTNISVSFVQRTIKSNKPYSIGINKTDTSFTYASVTLTKIVVTYDDGTVETSGPGGPLVIKARDETSVNSGNGGQVFETKMRHIGGIIPDMITRDESFTLELEGYFSLDDGRKVPFTIEQHYDVELEQTKKKAMEVMQDR